MPCWALPPPGAKRCPSPAHTGGALAAGRVQAGGGLSSCLLHKGTILGAPRHPHQGTSSPAVRLPPPHRKETSLGMGMGTGTASGAPQRVQEAVAFLREQQQWKAGPARVGSSVLGLEGAVNTHCGHHLSCDAGSLSWGRRRVGAGSEIGRLIPVPGYLLQEAQRLPMERAKAICVLQATPAALGLFVLQGGQPPCRAPPAAGHSLPLSLGAGVVPGCDPFPGPHPAYLWHPRSYKGLFTAGGGSTQPCAGRQSIPGPCPRQQERLIFAWFLF